MQKKVTHVIEFQYLNTSSQLILSMYNPKANFDRLLVIVKSIFGESLDSYSNFKHYPNKPKKTDI